MLHPSSPHPLFPWGPGSVWILISTPRQVSSIVGINPKHFLGACLRTREFSPLGLSMQITQTLRRWLRQNPTHGNGWLWQYIWTTPPDSCFTSFKFPWLVCPWGQIIVVLPKKWTEQNFDGSHLWIEKGIDSHNAWRNNLSHLKIHFCLFYFHK